MTLSTTAPGSPLARAAMVAAACVGLTVAVFADSATGTAKFAAKSGPVTVTFQHAYLVKGPDVASGKTVRRLVLSVDDISAALKKCEAMSCSDGGIGSGLTVDFDAGSRLNYWFVANDQMIQHSDTTPVSSAKLTTDTPTRIAGTLAIDDQPSGGPVVNVQFDASLIKTLTK